MTEPEECQETALLPLDRRRQSERLDSQNSAKRKKSRFLGKRLTILVENNGFPVLLLFRHFSTFPCSIYSDKSN